MKFALALLVLVFVGANSALDTMPASIGGISATEVVPYLVAILENGQHHCGGAIIGKRHILTAAHCTYGQFRSLTPRVLSIKYGVTDVKDPRGVRVPVQEIIRHERYIHKSANINYDIAILKLKKDIIFGKKANPINLPKCKGCTYATSGSLAGWGQQHPRRKTANDRHLQIISLDILPSELCRRKVRDFNSRKLCTLNGIGEGACHGDSGGPLVANNAVIGITSYGIKGCAGGFPDVFTKVDAYLDWIKKHTK